MKTNIVAYRDGVFMGKISPYIGKVRVPCKKCYSLVSIGIKEKLAVCPVCEAKW